MISSTRTILLALCVIVLSAGQFVAQETQSNQLFVVIVDGKRGYIDKTGKIVIEPKWGGASNFSEGLAVVATHENGYQEGYIDETGKVVIKPQYVMARDFSEGLAAVGFGEFTMHGGGKHTTGFIDKSGKLIIAAKFYGASDFSEGLAAVNRDEKYGFIDRSGEIVIPMQFDEAWGFSEGLACVKIGNKFGFIDKTGKLVIKAKYSLPATFREGLANVIIGGKTNSGYGGYYNFTGKVEFIDKKGKTLIRLPQKAVSASNFSEGLAVVGVKGEKDYTYNGYINKSGTFVIKPQFSTAQDFSNGLATVILNPNFGFSKEGFAYIDKEGKIVLSFDYPKEFSMVNDFENGLAWVEQYGNDVSKLQNTLYGYIDKTGTYIWRPTK